MKYLDTIIGQLASFLAKLDAAEDFKRNVDKEGFKKDPRKWLSVDDKAVQIYVRLAIHRGLRCLEIGDMQFSDLIQDQGLWTRKFLEEAHRINTLEAIAIESVADESLIGYLLLNGWIVDTVYHHLCVSLFLKTKVTSISGITQYKEVAL